MEFLMTPMRRERLIVEGGSYHITQRAPGRELLFLENRDYLRFISLLKKIKKEFSLSILAFSLLPNHLHLFLKIKDLNLNKAMKKLFQRYAQYFNKKYQRKGHVFCGVYRASLCNTDGYLITASLYIHLNAYKANLVKSPFLYKWHSLDVYIKPIKDNFIDRELILNILSSDLENAKEIYRKLIEDACNVNYENVIENKQAMKQFHRRLLNCFKEKFTNKSGLFNPFFGLEQQIENFIDKTRVCTTEDKNALKYLVEQLFSRGFSSSEIAQKLNYNRSNIYKIIGKVDKTGSTSFV